MKHSVLFLIVIGLLVLVLNHLFPGQLDVNNNGPQLVQLAIFGALISATVAFHYRHRLGEAFKHAITWSMLALILVVSYAMKDELLTTLVPGKTQIGEHGEYIVKKAEDGHFYLELQINSVRTRMMVDTGASSITLDYDTAERVGLKVDELRYTAPISTANGRTMAAPVALENVRLGRKEFTQLPAYVAQPGALETPLLGMNFLKQFPRVIVLDEKLIIAP